MKKHNIAQKGKRALSMLLVALMVLSCWVWVEPASLEANAATLTGDSNYLFAYFTGTSIEGQTIHLAVSQDGLNYTALSNNEPVIVPSKGTGCVRDPYIWYNENDGYYYILATDLDFTDTGSDYSDNSESFIIWRSKDLVHWYDETMIDVKAILGRLGINNNNMQAVWAPQVLWDGSNYVVYFSLQCDATSNGSWNPLTIVYLKTTDLLDQDKYGNYGVIHNPGRHVIDADIIKKPGTSQYYMFYKDEAASTGIQSIYYMISDNGPTGPYYAPNNANEGRGPQLFAEVGKNIEGCNSFFDDNGNLITFVDEFGYWNSLTNQTEAHFHVSSSSDFNTFTILPDSSHNINSLSPRHGSVVKITDEEYNRLLAYANEITSSSFPETEVLSDHLVGRYFTTADYTYNAAKEQNDLTLTDGSISTAIDEKGDYYAYFNAAGAEINLANLISNDLNIKDGFTITFSASAPASLGANARFFDISNNWSQRTNPAECYLHMSPVAESNGLYVGAYNGPVTTSSWTWASEGRNYNDGVMHEYIISFADGNMILYIDGKLAMKRDRYNMNAITTDANGNTTGYGDNFLTDIWYQSIGNSTMRIGKSEWSDPLFTGSMQNLCIYDCSLSYYDVQKMQKTFDDQAGKTTIAKIAVPETVYMTPSTGASTTGQYYVNNRIHDGSSEVNLEVNPAQTNGVVEFYIPGAEKFSIEVNTKTSGIGDIVLAEAGATSDSYENTTYDAAANGYFSYTTAGLYINGTGITAGNTALAEWKITVRMKDGSEKIHYAYSTLYAPYLNPVGSAILLEGRYSGNSKLFASSMAWVSGVHKFTNNPAANYYARTDTMVPLINGGAIGTGDNEDNPDTNWISASAGSNTLSTASFRYNQVKGSSGELGAIGVYRSPVANLTIDTSRYSNFNQIPNLTVGFNYTDKENSGEVYWYVSDYTDGDMTYMKDYSLIDSRDNVNTQAGYYYNIQGNLITNTGVNQAQVSTGAEHNAKWDRAVKPGTSNTYIFKSGAYAYRSTTFTKGAAYSVNYIQVNGTNVDKTDLRNLVLKATYFNESDYTTGSWSAFKTALQNAAAALGNPANEDVSSVTTALQNEINALQTTVTLNANGGTINGSTQFNVTVGPETTVTYDVSTYTPVRDGYIFMGWATTPDAQTGSKSTVTAGLMPTLYALWQKAEINVTFDNLIDFNAWNKAAGDGVVTEVTDTGFTITSNNGVGESTSPSPFFPVKPGKSYKIDIDFTGDNWDVYIFFCDANGAWVDFADGPSNRYSSNKSTGIDKDNAVFTAPNKDSVVKAQIRVDSNGSNNTVRFENIRVYEHDGTDIDVSPVNKYVNYGTVYGTLPTPTKECYTFNGWKNGNDTVDANSTMNSGSTVYLKSDWFPTNYTITYDTDGGSAVAKGTYTIIDPVTIASAPTKAGYTFGGWKVTTAGGNWSDETTVNAGQSFTAGEKHGNVTLTAQWTPNKYTVTFDGNGGTPASTTKTVTYDSAYGDLPTVTRNGYNFGGWYNGSTPVEATDTVSIDGDHILKAEWTAEDYTIKYVTDSGTLADGAPTGYNIESTITVPSATKPGYTFAGWTVSGGNGWSATVNAGDKVSGAYGNVTLTAQWETITYTVNYDENGGSTVADDTYTIKDAITIPSTSKTGYTFGGWVVTSSDSNWASTVNAGDNVSGKYGNVTLTAQWTANSYTIEFNGNGATSGSTASMSMTYDTAKNLTANGFTRDGYDFLGWSTSPTGEKVYENQASVSGLSETNGATVTLYAVWQINNSALVEDNVAIDFVHPTLIKPLENDTIFNEEAKNGSYSFNGLSATENGTYSKNGFAGKYGNFTISDETVTYTPTGVINGAENVLYYSVSVTVNGKTTTLTSTITVAPASNVYYEETIATNKNISDTVEWTPKNNTVEIIADTSAADVYGYNDAYNNTNTFSGNSYIRADVTPDAKKSDTKVFEFVGSGFDLISACGTNTGVQLVKISKLQSDGSYKALKSIIVDTYFTDTKIMNGDLLHQVPIVSYRPVEMMVKGEKIIPYGTYKVETTATYLNSAGAVKSGTATIAYSSAFGNGTIVETGSGEPSKALLKELEELGFEDLGNDIEVIWMDDNSAFNGGSGSPNASVLSGFAKSYYAEGETTTITGLRNYIDGVRVYNPLNGGNGYYKDSEQSATYYNIVEELDLAPDVLDKNMAYIESGDLNYSLIFGTDFNFDAYNSQGGPKGEIYLKSGDAIAFKFTAVTNGKDAYAMLGMRAVKGTANAKVYTAASKNDPYTKEISSATEMYYNVSPAVTVVNGEVTIIVANTGTGTLAVNNLKLVNGNLADENTIDSDGLSGSVANGNVADVPTPVVPDAGQGEGGNVEDIPATDVDTDTNVPENDTETDVEDEIEINVSTMFPGMPASIASFLEMLFKFLSQLVSSLGF